MDMDEDATLDIGEEVMLDIRCEACNKVFYIRQDEIPHNRRIECTHCRQGYVIDLDAYLEHREEIEKFIERLEGE